MTEHHDDSSIRPFWKRPLVLAGAVIMLIAAAVGGALLAPYVLNRSAPESLTSASTARPAPETAAKPATPAAETPASVPESARETKPRTKKKAEPAAPGTPTEPATPATGELHIDSDVPGAMVFLDRKYLGNTPVTARDVAPGPHRLNLSADGYDGYADSIDVAAGPAEIMVRFKEVRLKEAIDVVHKHGMGSCEGRLLADPQGVRYETANRDDAFTMRFADVETFEVDYLKKNLRIKKRGGKSYNFTTKAENADPLFVFHRNVDKVRKQVTGAPAGR